MWLMRGIRLCWLGRGRMWTSTTVSWLDGLNLHEVSLRMSGCCSLG